MCEAYTTNQNWNTLDTASVRNIFFSSYGRTLDLPVYLSHYIKVKSLFPLQKLTMTKGKETRFHQNIKTSNPVHIFCSWRGGSKGGGDDTPLKLLSLKIHVRTV